MLPLFVLGIALLIGLVLTARWFVTAEPRAVIGVVKWVAVAVVIVVTVFLAVTGRLGLALMALPFLLPWFLRMRMLARTAKTFSRMSGAQHRERAAAGGPSSEVETRFLRMTLDHASGDMSGEVLEGPYAGKRLDQLSFGEMVDLMRLCWIEDERSARVLEAYLDRAQPDWRKKAEAEEARRSRSSAAPGGMSRTEAYQVLGLEPGASEQEIKDAYRRLIANLHPDHGGSSYLAAKINQAKDILLTSG